MGTKPYLCPVCKGKTVVKKGFYPDEPDRTDCKACFNGIIYGASDDYTWTYTNPNYYQYPYPTYYYTCPLCGGVYTGTHTCNAPGYTSPPNTSGSNPPTIPEVAKWLGGDYLHPETVSMWPDDLPKFDLEEILP